MEIKWVHAKVDLCLPVFFNNELRVTIGNV